MLHPHHECMPFGKQRQAPALHPNNALPLESHANVLRKLGTFLLLRRRHSGDNIEQLFVDRGLALVLECAGQFLQALVDVFLCALHRGQAAGMLTGKRLGAGPVERDEELLPDERRKACAWFRSIQDSASPLSFSFLSMVWQHDRYVVVTDQSCILYATTQQFRGGMALRTGRHITRHREARHTDM